MGKTKIQWTTSPNGEPGYTHNPWRGCRKVAPECENCYIVTTAPFRVAGQTHGAVRVRASAATLRSPLAWNRSFDPRSVCNDPACGRRVSALTGYCTGNSDCRGTGLLPAPRPRVFCLSLGDWLDDENVPIEWLADLLHTIFETPNLDWLLLTKRPQNWLSRLTRACEVMFARVGWRESAGMVESWLAAAVTGPMAGGPPANVWIGVSAGADQAAALDIPARVYFLSCEPMLKPLDTTHAARFDWVIFGGESGKKARECNVNWILDGIIFCRANRIACFVKQLGARPVQPVKSAMGDLHPLKDSHGGDMSEWPEDLRVREFPSL